jgi:fluoride exporter
VVPSFPLGTFAANMTATIVFGVAMLTQGLIRSPLSAMSCSILYGIIDGFCGCLSTISTFAVEIDTLTRINAYVYAMVSISGGITILVLLVGIPSWIVGFAPMCDL